MLFRTFKLRLWHFTRSMARTDLLESVLHQLIDEEALGVCFELHRAIKLGYYELLYPEDR